MYTDVFTTGQVAKILRVSQQTVIRCTKQGTLKFYRIPGSRHRRFSLASVQEFMRDNNIPVEWLTEHVAQTGPSQPTGPSQSST
jgi:two-component system OmpR family response regulator